MMRLILDIDIETGDVVLSSGTYVKRTTIAPAHGHYWNMDDYTLKIERHIPSAGIKRPAKILRYPERMWWFRKR